MYFICIKVYPYHPTYHQLTPSNIQPVHDYYRGRQQSAAETLGEIGESLASDFGENYQHMVFWTLINSISFTADTGNSTRPDLIQLPSIKIN